MREKIEENLSNLLKMLGSGDVGSARLLFVGIEEGGNSTCLDKPIPAPEMSVEPWEGTDIRAQHGRSAVWEIIAKISAMLFDVENLNAYQTERLFHRGDYNVLVELFPLPKKSTGDWGYEATITREQYDEWIFNNIHRRYAMIRDVRAKIPNHFATVCFGRGNWQDFINCFRLSWCDYETCDDFRIYRSQRVILAPFFGYRTMSHEKTKELARQIRSLNPEASP